MGFPGGASGKDTVYAGDIRNVASIPGSGRSPGEGHGNPLQYSCLENPMDKGNLMDPSSWGHKELDTTEATEHTAQSTSYVKT